MAGAVFYFSNNAARLTRWVSLGAMVSCAAVPRVAAQPFIYAYATSQSTSTARMFGSIDRLTTDVMYGSMAKN